MGLERKIRGGGGELTKVVQFSLPESLSLSRRGQRVGREAGLETPYTTKEAARGRVRGCEVGVLWRDMGEKDGPQKQEETELAPPDDATVPGAPVIPDTSPPPARGKSVTTESARAAGRENVGVQPTPNPVGGVYPAGFDNRRTLRHETALDDLTPRGQTWYTWPPLPRAHFVRVHESTWYAASVTHAH